MATWLVVASLSTGDSINGSRLRTLAVLVFLGRYACSALRDDREGRELVVKQNSPQQTCATWCQSECYSIQSASIWSLSDQIEAVSQYIHVAIQVQAKAVSPVHSVLERFTFGTTCTDNATITKPSRASREPRGGPGVLSVVLSRLPAHPYAIGGVAMLNS